jgi:hypothetical protein
MKLTKRPAPDAPLPPNIYPVKDPRGAIIGYEAKVSVGSGKARLWAPFQFWKDRDDAAMTRHVTEARAALQREREARGVVEAGTLAAGVRQYLDLATLTAATRKVRAFQLAYWMAQPAAQKAPVLTPEEFKADRAALAERGVPMPNRGRTLGDLPFARAGKSVTASDEMIDRVRTVLRDAFAPTDETNDPTEFGNTSNNYRQALFQLFKFMNRNHADAPRNPIALIETRAIPGPQKSAVPMRIVREILTYTASRFGRRTGRSILRLAVLAWVNITPKQLSQLDPRAAFHDDPDATREDIAAGVITLTKHARLKGRAKVLKEPATVPLTPYGVEAMRAYAAAYAADPAAFRKLSASPLNKKVQKAATTCQAALAARGIEIDLAGFTLYHLKHSLATAMTQATNGLIDLNGNVTIDPAVVKAWDHKHERTTRIYTAVAVDPILRKANAALTAFLDRELAAPLAPTPLRVVRRKEAV